MTRGWQLIPKAPNIIRHRVEPFDRVVTLSKEILESMKPGCQLVPTALNIICHREESFKPLLIAYGTEWSLLNL